MNLGQIPGDRFQTTYKWQTNTSGLRAQLDLQTEYGRDTIHHLGMFSNTYGTRNTGMIEYWVYHSMDNYQIIIDHYNDQQQMQNQTGLNNQYIPMHVYHLSWLWVKTIPAVHIPNILPEWSWLKCCSQLATP